MGKKADPVTRLNAPPWFEVPDDASLIKHGPVDQHLGQRKEMADMQPAGKKGKTSSNLSVLSNERWCLLTSRGFFIFKAASRELALWFEIGASTHAASSNDREYTRLVDQEWKKTTHGFLVDVDSKAGDDRLILCFNTNDQKVADSWKEEINTLAKSARDLVKALPDLAHSQPLCDGWMMKRSHRRDNEETWERVWSVLYHTGRSARLGFFTDEDMEEPKGHVALTGSSELKRGRVYTPWYNSTPASQDEEEKSKYIYTLDASGSKCGSERWIIHLDFSDELSEDMERWTVSVADVASQLASDDMRRRKDEAALTGQVRKQNLREGCLKKAAVLVEKNFQDFENSQVEGNAAGSSTLQHPIAAGSKYFSRGQRRAFQEFAKNLFKWLDVDGSGELDCVEFLRLLINYSNFESHAPMGLGDLENMDFDVSGSITEDELLKILMVFYDVCGRRKFATEIRRMISMFNGLLETALAGVADTESHYIEPLERTWSRWVYAVSMPPRFSDVLTSDMETCLRYLKKADDLCADMSSITKLKDALQITERVAAHVTEFGELKTCRQAKRDLHGLRLLFRWPESGLFRTDGTPFSLEDEDLKLGVIIARFDPLADVGRHKEERKDVRIIGVVGENERNAAKRDQPIFPPGSDKITWATDTWCEALEWFSSDELEGLAFQAQIQEGQRRNASGRTIDILIKPSHLAYAVAKPGVRIAFCSPERRQLYCATVLGLEEDGLVSVQVDNAGVEKIDPRPGNVVLAKRIKLPIGTRVQIVHNGRLFDATVQQWLGEATGNRHTLQFTSGIRKEFDLNELNHCVQRFDSIASWEAARNTYCKACCDAGRYVEDSITLQRLEIEKQLLRIATEKFTHEHANVQDSARDDLEWVPREKFQKKDLVLVQGNRAEVIDGPKFKEGNEVYSVRFTEQSRSRSQLVYKDIPADYLLGAQVVSGVDVPEISEVEDMIGLVPFLLLPNQSREQGGVQTQPICLRAGPGTGKTWSMQQLFYYLCKSDQNQDEVSESALGADELPNGAPVKWVPCLIYIQKLARMMREYREDESVDTARDHILFYVRSEFPPGPSRNMLEQAYAMRTMIILLDGVDEASDVKESVEELVINNLVPRGFQIVLTSRPEGIRLRLYARDFAILNLAPLNDKQQRAAIEAQLHGNQFFEHLTAFSTIRKTHDQLYLEDAFPKRSDRQYLRKLKMPNLFFIHGTKEYDPQMRTKTLDGSRPVCIQRGPLQSKYLQGLEHEPCFSEEGLRRLDDMLDKMGPNPSGKELKMALNVVLGDNNAQLSLIIKLCLLVKKWQRKPPENHAQVTATILWPQIVARTDEILLAGENNLNVFKMVATELLNTVGLSPDEALIIGPLKDPVRIHEKALDDYLDRFDDDVLPEANVVDVIRARLLCSDGEKLTELMKQLQNGFRMQIGEQSVLLELIRCKNKFANLDPTHFRNILNNLRMFVGNTNQFVEMQVHHVKILDYNEVSHAHDHYDFFRAHLANAYESELGGRLDFILDKRMQVFDEICKVPVKLSIFIIVLRESAGACMPEDAFDLYRLGISSVLKMRYAGDVSKMQLSYELLETISLHNHPNRIFTQSDVAIWLENRTDLKAIWQEWLRDGDIPLVKILTSGDTEGEYQFRHLSFQEALFVFAITNGKVPSFYDTDDSLIDALNGEWQNKQGNWNNIFDIGRGHLGEYIASQRIEWDLARTYDKKSISESSKEKAGDLRLKTKAFTNLRQLLIGATSLLKLNIPLELSQQVEDGRWLVPPEINVYLSSKSIWTSESFLPTPARIFYSLDHFGGAVPLAFQTHPSLSGGLSSKTERNFEFQHQPFFHSSRYKPPQPQSTTITLIFQSSQCSFEHCDFELGQQCATWKLKTEFSYQDHRLPRFSKHEFASLEKAKHSTHEDEVVSVSRFWALVANEVDGPDKDIEPGRPLFHMIPTVMPRTHAIFPRLPLPKHATVKARWDFENLEMQVPDPNTLPFILRKRSALHDERAGPSYSYDEDEEEEEEDPVSDGEDGRMPRVFCLEDHDKEGFLQQYTNEVRLNDPSVLRGDMYSDSNLKNFDTAVDEEAWVHVPVDVLSNTESGKCYALQNAGTDAFLCGRENYRGMVCTEDKDEAASWTRHVDGAKTCTFQISSGLKMLTCGRDGRLHLELSRCSFDLCQKWIVLEVDEGLHTIQNRRTGSFLSVKRNEIRKTGTTAARGEDSEEEEQQAFDLVCQPLAKEEAAMHADCQWRLTCALRGEQQVKRQIPQAQLGNGDGELPGKSLAALTEPLDSTEWVAKFKIVKDKLATKIKNRCDDRFKKYGEDAKESEVWAIEAKRATAEGCTDIKFSFDKWRVEKYGAKWPRDLFFVERLEVARPEDAPDFWSQLRAEERIRLRARDEYNQLVTAGKTHIDVEGESLNIEDEYLKLVSRRYVSSARKWAFVGDREISILDPQFDREQCKLWCQETSEASRIRFDASLWTTQRVSNYLPRNMLHNMEARLLKTFLKFSILLSPDGNGYQGDPLIKQILIERFVKAAVVAFLGLEDDHFIIVNLDCTQNDINKRAAEGQLHGGTSAKHGKRQLVSDKGGDEYSDASEAPAGYSSAKVGGEVEQCAGEVDEEGHQNQTQEERNEAFIGRFLGSCKPFLEDSRGKERRSIRAEKPPARRVVRSDMLQNDCPPPQFENIGDGNIADVTMECRGNNLASALKEGLSFQVSAEKNSAASSLGKDVALLNEFKIIRGPQVVKMRPAELAPAPFLLTFNVSAPAEGRCGALPGEQVQQGWKVRERIAKQLDIKPYRVLVQTENDVPLEGKKTLAEYGITEDAHLSVVIGEINNWKEMAKADFIRLAKSAESSAADRFYRYLKNVEDKEDQEDLDMVQRDILIVELQKIEEKRERKRQKEERRRSAAESADKFVKDRIAELGPIDAKEAVKAKCEELRAVSQEKAAAIASMKEDLQGDLDSVQPLLGTIESSLQSLSKGDFMELSSFAKPPAPVRIVVEALCTLFEYEPTWSNCQWLLSQHFYVMDRMINLNKDRIAPAIIQQLQAYIDSPMMELDTVRKASLAAYNINHWIRAIYSYHPRAKVFQAKRDKLIACEEDLEILMLELDTYERGATGKFSGEVDD